MSPIEVVLALSLLTVWVGTFWAALYIEDTVIESTLDKTTSAMALYLDTVLASEFESVETRRPLSGDRIAKLDAVTSRAAERAQFVGLKVWGPGGLVLFSNDRELIGNLYDASHGTLTAWDGQVAWEVSGLSGEQHTRFRSEWRELLEVFTPIRSRATGNVVAVAEFYFPLDDLSATLRWKRLRTWFVVVALSLPIYALLAVAVRRTSRTVARQDRELASQVEDLDRLLAENRRLNERLLVAAGRATALNEQVRQRTRSELHDGPLQDLSFAVLQLDRLIARHRACSIAVREACEFEDRIADTRAAVTLAMEEIRRVAEGLTGIEVGDKTVPEIVGLVVDRHRSRTSTQVDLELGELPASTPVAVKITLYRFLQEALNNAYRHARGVGQRVAVWSKDSRICVRVADDGPGFDIADEMMAPTRLGLRGLRDRVEILGGDLVVDSSPGAGTRLTACLPGVEAGGDEHGL
ncbi:MAG TPA: sensor histidine kinase [Candidatus Sulfomarinibacteraceae bacterium]|nr:sensor histidine kinase [Candidatus Sulfomarinibacteraceae bacterium]